MRGIRAFPVGVTPFWNMSLIWASVRFLSPVGSGVRFRLCRHPFPGSGSTSTKHSTPERSLDRSKLPSGLWGVWQLLQSEMCSTRYSPRLTSDCAPPGSDAPPRQPPTSKAAATRQLDSDGTDIHDLDWLGTSGRVRPAPGSSANAT